MTSKDKLRAKLRESTLSGADRAHVLDALEDAVAELESDEVAEFVSQKTVDKINSSIEIMRRVNE